MRDKLPLYIENRELPNDEFSKNNNRRGLSNGYVSVSILYLVSVLITVVSVLTIVFFRK